MSYGGKHYHAFTYCGEYFLFDTFHYITLQVSEEFYSAFFKYVNDKDISFGDQKYFETLQQLQENGYFFAGKAFDIENDLTTKGIASLSFAPIYQCNFRCKYCFAEKRDSYNIQPCAFDKNTVIKTLDWFTQTAYPNSKGYRLDFVSGGEPLMNYAAIITAVEYAKRFKKITGKYIQIWLCTNGTYFDEEICRYLDNNNISIGVSLDGNKETNDQSRIDCSGKGTYDIVTSELHKILNNENYSKKFKEIWALSVITPTSDMSDILSHHKNMGFSSVQMKLVRSSKKQYSLSTDTLLEKYAKFAKWLLKTLDEGIEYLLLILNDNDYFGKIIKRIILKEAYMYRCKAGRSKITICPNGDVYPCDSFVGNENYLLGNINTSFNPRSVCFHDVNHRNPCSDCSIKYLCGGDCYYNSMLHTGNHNAPDKKMCEIFIGLCNIAIWLTFHIEKDYPDSYKKIERILDIKGKVNKE